MSINLTKDELEFKNDPKLIRFEYSHFLGLFVKSTTIKLIDQDEYEYAINNFYGLSSCYRTFNVNEISYNVYFRTKHCDEFWNRWIDYPGYARDGIFIDSLARQYPSIKNYILVPAYDNYNVHDIGEILVSMNEFAEDFPEIQMDLSWCESNETSGPVIGYLDKEYKYAPINTEVTNYFSDPIEYLRKRMDDIFQKR